MKNTVIAACLLLAACRGPAGSKGETGIQGIRGPGQVEVIGGPVTSNNFTITDAKFVTSKQVTIYLKDSLGNLVEVPYYLPLAGVNTYAVLNGSQLTFSNAALAGATDFVVVIIS